MREIKFEYGFESVNGTVKKVYHLNEIPNIHQKCDVWNVLPIKYVRQFTGLPDKNGREIYEGDVMKSLGTDICVVRWVKQLACFMLENTNPTDDFDNILLPLYKGYEHREIIGNIHELCKH